MPYPSAGDFKKAIRTQFDLYGKKWFSTHKEEMENYWRKIDQFEKKDKILGALYGFYNFLLLINSTTLLPAVALLIAKEQDIPEEYVRQYHQLRKNKTSLSKPDTEWYFLKLLKLTKNDLDGVYGVISGFSYSNSDVVTFSLDFKQEKGSKPKKDDIRYPEWFVYLKDPILQRGVANLDDKDEKQEASEWLVRGDSQENIVNSFFYNEQDLLSCSQLRDAMIRKNKLSVMIDEPERLLPEQQILIPDQLKRVALPDEEKHQEAIEGFVQGGSVIAEDQEDQLEGIPAGEPEIEEQPEAEGAIVKPGEVDHVMPARFLQIDVDNREEGEPEAQIQIEGKVEVAEKIEPKKINKSDVIRQEDGQCYSVSRNNASVGGLLGQSISQIVNPSPVVPSAPPIEDEEVEQVVKQVIVNSL